MNALHTSSITSLPLLARGKVRDNYAVGADRLLMVASDRISAFDVIMGEPITGKGELLTKMALFWFDKLTGIVPNHLTGEAPGTRTVIMGSMLHRPAQPVILSFTFVTAALSISSRRA